MSCCVSFITLLLTDIRELFAGWSIAFPYTYGNQATSKNTSHL